MARAEELTRARRPDLWALYEKKKNLGYTPRSFADHRRPEIIAMNLLQTLEAEQMKAVPGQAAPPNFVPATR